MRLIQFTNQLNNLFFIKNNNNKTIYFHSTKQIFNLLSLLKDQNYLSYKIKSVKQNLDLKNNYWELNVQSHRFTKLTLISKPSRHISVSYRKLLDIKYDCILSTNLGLISKEEAIKNKTGGFIKFKIS